MALLETHSETGKRSVAAVPGHVAGIDFVVIGLTTFLSAFLLFQVQPLMAKFILPWFGGAPAVWTTCLLFFQVLLLAGYTYAHVLTRYSPPRLQPILHAVFLCGSVFFLPILPESAWKPHSPEAPTVRILLLLTSCVGMPYLLLSSTGPLLQRWLSLQYPNVIPYRLYALSNVGSLLALLTFPFVFEPAFTRSALSSIWGWCFAGYVAACAICAFRFWRRPAPAGNTPIPAELHAERESRPGIAVKLQWFALPACASILLLATTNKLCQDTAVVPFLWVVPLSLYLLSFVLCFDKPAWYFRRGLTMLVLPSLILLSFVSARAYEWPILGQILIYSGILFVSCMVCHGEVYRLKPQPEHLTSFYLSIAAGGAAGGVMVAVLAPLVFNSYAELHWGMLLMFVLLFLTHLREKSTWSILHRWWKVWPVVLTAMVLLSAGILFQKKQTGRNVVFQSRNFYGVLRVQEFGKTVPMYHGYQLSHGSITHGLQFTHPTMSSMPTTYYHEQSGIGRAMIAFPRQSGRKIGIVGLGVGTLASYGKEGDHFRFYEIDPEVESIARMRFTYLEDSKATIEVIMGDGRLSLENDPSQAFDILVLDAFSSDAIPVHLLTSEAFEIYGRHMKDNGLIAVHVTNRHLDLLPVVYGLASEAGYRVLDIESRQIGAPVWIVPSRWLLLSRDEAFLNSPAIRVSAREITPGSVKPVVWTDDYASLWSVLALPGSSRNL